MPVSGLSRLKDERVEIGVTRIVEVYVLANSRSAKSAGDDGKRPLATIHGSAFSSGSKNAAQQFIIEVQRYIHPQQFQQFLDSRPYHIRSSRHFGDVPVTSGLHRLADIHQVIPACSKSAETVTLP